MNSGVTALSNNGITTTITYSSAGYAYVCDQSENTCFDALPSSGGSMGVVGTALTFSFSTPVSAVGTTFEDESDINLADYSVTPVGTASLTLYDGTTVLGTITQTESAFGQVYLAGTDASGANITSAVIAIDSEVVPTTMAFLDAANEPASCVLDGINNPGAFSLSSPGGLAKTLECPQTAETINGSFSSSAITLPDGFCITNATACSTFQQIGGAISFAGPQSFSSGFQVDSLDLVDGTPAAANVAATPEPSSLALLGTGILSVAGVVRRRLARSA